MRKAVQVQQEGRAPVATQAKKGPREPRDPQVGQESLGNEDCQDLWALEASRAYPASPGTPVQMARKASLVLLDRQDHRVPMANVGREDFLVKEDELAYQAHRESAASLGHQDIPVQGDFLVRKDPRGMLDHRDLWVCRAAVVTLANKVGKDPAVSKAHQVRKVHRVGQATRVCRELWDHPDLTESPEKRASLEHLVLLV